MRPKNLYFEKMFQEHLNHRTATFAMSVLAKESLVKWKGEQKEKKDSERREV